MAATEPDGSAPPPPLTDDLATRGPWVTTRTLTAVVLVLVVLLLVSAVVGFVLLHQPRLTPLPVPSVSSIA
ncbi:hypothetical protein [Microlunatus antarcticus]|uniref:Uncharacterized protein n=1 Tax=Microlunatus antarcticus TaxID=53388 RepID=A0A7W5P898_9ACTN|nr:hypothetical protein [Microlunatus antarcticus]MBB3328340.1 hypothetical protein [Microlunatus antarcticus]